MRQDQTTTLAGRFDTAADIPESPLTLSIMNRTNAALDTANEINNRLWQLRDRLFGSPPEGATSSAANAKVEARAFWDAYNDKSRDLGAVLASIDHLSGEIANRL